MMVYNDYEVSTYFNVPDINRLSKNKYKARKSVIPLNPTNIKEVHTFMDKEKIVSTRCKLFLLINIKIKMYWFFHGN